MTLKDMILEPNRYIDGQDIPKESLYDKYVGQGETPYALIYPLTNEEIVTCVAYANKHKLSIVTQGSKTGLAGATFSQGNNLILDMSKMNRILDFNPETLTLTVEPGVTLEAVQQYVEPLNYFYPPDPGSKTSTIGGNLATNAGGMRAIKYGVTRDYVREITIVLANEETLVLGSENIKSSSGYDLKNLFIGSEGTLGIISQIKLKVIPLPKHKKSYLAAFDSLTESTQAVLSTIQLGLDPTALEFFEKEMVMLAEKQSGITLPLTQGQSYLLITLDGQGIEEREIRLKETLTKFHALEILDLSGSVEASVWKLRDQLLSAVVNYSEQVTLDETVPINKLADIYAYTKELEKEYGISIMSFGHAGDGNLHTCVIKGQTSDQEWIIKRDEILHKLYNKIKEYGGLPSAEHGIGLIKKPYFQQMFDKNVIDLMRAVKKAIDPNNMFNPNKIL